MGILCFTGSGSISRRRLAHLTFGVKVTRQELLLQDEIREAIYDERCGGPIEAVLTYQYEATGPKIMSVYWIEDAKVLPLENVTCKLDPIGDSSQGPLWKVAGRHRQHNVMVTVWFTIDKPKMENDLRKVIPGVPLLGDTTSCFADFLNNLATGE